MSKLGSTIVTAVIGLVVVAAAAPVLIRLTHALIPLIVTVAVVAALLRAVWFFTR